MNEKSIRADQLEALLRPEQLIEMWVPNMGYREVVQIKDRPGNFAHLVIVRCIGVNVALLPDWIVRVRVSEAA